MKYLLTYSLLNSFSWLYKIYSQGKDNEFKNALKRLPIPDNEYMKAGREFENDVKKYLFYDFRSDSASPGYIDSVITIGNIVEGGTWQVKGYCDLQIAGINFLLYGIADVLKGPIIYDIKYVKKYEYGKYQDSEQHKVYFRLFPGMREFIYLISDGNNVYKENYQRDQTVLLNSEISDFWSWMLANPEYMKLYTENWEAL
jgi:hypothetical protein